MNFDGSVRPVDVINPSLLSSLKEQIDRDFHDKWIRRTLNLMPDTYCLKAITPSQIDVLAAEDSNHLREILVPLVTPYVRADETLVYLDINNLPSGAECLPHIDHALMHILSRRLHIPLSTNADSKFVFRSRTGIQNYHMNVGKVYEVNNEILHAVGNYGETDRWHIIIDVMDTECYNYLVKARKTTTIALDGIINFTYSKDIIEEVMTALRGPALEI